MATNARADLALGVVGEAFQILHLDAGYAADRGISRGDVAHGFRRAVAAPPPRASFLRAFREIAFELAALFEHGGEPGRGIVDAGLEQARDRAQIAALAGGGDCAAASPVSASIRRTPAEGTAPSATIETRPISPVRRAWVPPHNSMEKGFRRAFRGKLFRTAAHGDDAHLVAIFLAEQGARAGFDRLVHRHQLGGNRGVLQHQRIGQALHLRQLFIAHRLGMT